MLTAGSCAVWAVKFTDSGYASGAPGLEPRPRFQEGYLKEDRARWHYMGILGAAEGVRGIMAKDIYGPNIGQGGITHPRTLVSQLKCKAGCMVEVGYFVLTLFLFTCLTLAMPAYDLHTDQHIIPVPYFWVSISICWDDDSKAEGHIWVGPRQREKEFYKQYKL